MFNTIAIIRTICHHFINRCVSLNLGICYIFTLKKKYPNNLLTQPNLTRQGIKHVLRFVPWMDGQTAGHLILCCWRINYFYLNLDVSLSLSAVLNHNTATMYIYSRNEYSLYNVKQLNCAKGIKIIFVPQILKDMLCFN